MLMEEVSCNSGAEEFRVIGDTETSGQIFNQPKNYQNSLHDCILHQNTGGWTTPGPVYGSQAPCAPPGDTSHISVGDNFISGFYTCAHPRYALCSGPKRFYTREADLCLEFMIIRLRQWLNYKLCFTCM